MDAQTREVLQFDLVLELVAGRASSPLGKEWVLGLEPLEETGAIEARFAPIRDLLLLLSRNSSLPIGGLFDARPLFDKVRIEGTALAEDELLPLASFLDVCTRLSSFRDQNRQDLPDLTRLLDQVSENRDLRRLLHDTLDKDGFIRDDATKELAAARAALRSAESQLLKTVNRLVADLHARGVLQEQFSTFRNGRHVFPVKAGARGRVSGIMHGSSTSRETVYVEPAEVVEAGNEVESRRESEQQEVHRILLRLTAEFRPFLPLARHTLELLREVDGLYAIARTANERGWNIPLIVDSGAVRLFNAHHPLLNLRGGRSIPITMLLDRGDRCVVLSGPNAGGKTTAMKTLGLLALLVQCGCPIPAFPDSTIPLFTNVLADIGDRQDIQQGLSTFSGHIKRICELWAQATTRSLVLLDEVGTGTDPQEGGALALALLESFANRAALTVTTSHLNTVKMWAEDTEGIRNASFSLDPDTHEPTFALRLDLPGASEALEIAEREGLPGSILGRARGLVGQRHLEMGEMLRRIEDRERRLSTALKDAEARAATLAEQEKVARARAEVLRDERRELRETALRDKEKAIAEVRGQLERLIAELPSEDDLLRRKESLVRARAEAIRQQNLSSEERLRLAERQAELGGLYVGQKVFVGTLRQWGMIVRLDESARKSQVSIGRVPVWAAMDDLMDHDPAERRAEQQQIADDAASTDSAGARRRKKSRRIKNALRDAEEYSGPTMRSAVTVGGRAFVSAAPARGQTMELDLHGCRVDEALKMLDKFLDQSLLSSFPYVRVCHGTGSGRLYKAVHEFLRQHPAVKKYRFGTPDEGGGGMTVVEL